MAIVELTYPSLLNGVSQQTPRERLNGQLTQQINMLSDPVTGLRRRPGFQHKTAITTDSESSFDYSKIYSQYLQIDNRPLNLVINTDIGSYYFFDQNFDTVATGSNQYLKAKSANSIQVTNNSGLGWILNTEQKPKPVNQNTSNNELHPQYSAYLNIATGAFLKDYVFEFQVDGEKTTLKYTTPKGDASGDAAISTPDGIAAKIANLVTTGKTQQNANNAATGQHDLNSKLNVYTQGSTLFFQSKNNKVVKLTNKSGANYATVSAAGKIQNISQLPAVLPQQADKWILAVGTSQSAMQYYKWDFQSRSWNECGDPQSYTNIDNMPLQIKLQESNPVVQAVRFQGRNAGDDQNNPYPQFIKNGISGIGTFMGRLVIMSGAYVCLSASRYPIRTMRSTVTQILDSDAVQVASGSASSASFQHAVQFNKDLLLFASTHQAVIPTGNTALTPQNAMLVVTAQQSVDTTARPAVVGQTLMYSTPISDQYFGVGELTPSSYTSSVYTPQNLTDHIPKFFKGKCRHIVSGGSVNIALFTSTTSPKDIYIHQYFWSGQQRQLVSWHKWTAPFDVASIHFAKDQIVILCANNNYLQIYTVDPRASQYIVGADIKPFLDHILKVEVKTQDNTNKKYIDMPADFNSQQVYPYITLVSLTSGLQLQPVGSTISDDKTKIYVDSSYKTQYICIGLRYKSSIIPNSPIIYSTGSSSRILISDSLDTLLQCKLTVQNTGYFGISVKDDRTSARVNSTRSPILWSSKDLDLGKSKVATISDLIIPCRTNAHTSQINLFTQGTKDMNILSLVYVVKLHQRKNRRIM